MGILDIEEKKEVIETPEVAEENQLFGDYELKGWQLGPRIYKILGASAVLHLVFFGVMAQFDLLQTKACDSPYVGKVCQVLDAVYLASVLGMTDTKYVDEDYQKDVIEEADVTWVNMTGTDNLFKYPDGYFASNNPEQTEQPTDLNGNPLQTTTTPTDQGNNLANSQQSLPPPNNSVRNQPAPDSPFTVEGSNPSVARNKPGKRTKQSKLNNDSPGKLPSDDSLAGNNGNKDGKDKPAENKDGDKGDFPGYPINRRPFQDLRDATAEKVAEQKINLTAPFAVTVEGVLTKEGKFDLAKTRFIKKEGDPAMAQLAEDAISAVNASGFMKYLEVLNNKKLTLDLKQDQNTITAVITSQMASDKEASQIASGFKGLMSLGKPRTEEGSDERILLENASVSAQGKSFILNFSIPQQIAQQMIQKHLKEAEKKSKPSGVAIKKEAEAKG